jgi:hypothetical protein
LNRRLRFMRPADCHFPIPRRNWCMWKDSNLRCSPLWVTALQAAAVAAGPHMHGGAQLSRTVIPRRSPRVQAGSPHRWRYAPIQKLAVAAREERASPEGTSRFERDGLSDCPTLPPPQRRKTCRRGPRSLAVGAGLEPAHASRREPRLQRSAMPFRSSYRYKDLAETIRFERMVPFKDTPR